MMGRSARVVASLLAGMVATALGLRFAFFSLPVWLASFLMAKSGLRGTNVAMNLFYLTTNIVAWTLFAYVVLSLIAKRDRG